MRYLSVLRSSGEIGRSDVPSLAMHRPGVAPITISKLGVFRADSSTIAAQS